MPEKEACLACHSQCSSPRHHSVAISIPTIIIGVIVCSIFALAISYVYKANGKEAKNKYELPQINVSSPPKGKVKPFSEATLMAFVLPEFPESKRGMVMKE